jgi:hypothetical protein
MENDTGHEPFNGISSIDDRVSLKQSFYVILSNQMLLKIVSIDDINYYVEKEIDMSRHDLRTVLF